MNEERQTMVRTVRVRRQWDDGGRIATYRRQDIQGIHWAKVSGGVKAPAPQYFLHGYVSCEGMLEGDVAHSGAHGGPCPHSIKVCVVKKDNDPNVFSELCSIAGPKPKRTRCSA